MPLYVMSVHARANRGRVLSFPGCENRKHDCNEHTQGNSDRCDGDAGDREQTFDECGLDGEVPEQTCGRYHSPDHYSNLCKRTEEENADP